jgi:hypothetical protein
MRQYFQEGNILTNMHILFLVNELEAMAEAMAGAAAQAHWRGEDASFYLALRDMLASEARRTGYGVGEIARLLKLDCRTVSGRLPSHLRGRQRGRRAAVPPEYVLRMGLPVWTIARAGELEVPPGATARPVALSAEQIAMLAPALSGLAIARQDTHLVRLAAWVSALATSEFETLPLADFLKRSGEQIGRAYSLTRRGDFWKTKVRTGVVEVIPRQDRRRLHLRVARIPMRQALVLWRNTWAIVQSGANVVMPSYEVFFRAK